MRVRSPGSASFYKILTLIGLAEQSCTQCECGSDIRAVPDLGERHRLRRIVDQGRDRALKPRNVVPRAELVTNVMIHAHECKAESAVHPFACGIRKRDPGVSVSKALKSKNLEEGRIKRSADSPSMSRAIYVRCDVDRPAISGALVMRVRVSVSDNISVNFTHEPGKAGENSRDAGCEFSGVRWYDLKGSRIVKHGG